MGIRTPVAGVKGQCPRPLDDGDTTLSSISKMKTLDNFSRNNHYDGCCGKGIFKASLQQTRLCWPYRYPKKGVKTPRSNFGVRKVSFPF
jgi:hypothetical protein